MTAIDPSYAVPMQYLQRQFTLIPAVLHPSNLSAGVSLTNLKKTQASENTEWFTPEI
ncbi:hypothetical protein NO263_03000 [Gluconacetobacter entanii]|uniref:Uncharacterized protein n=1 Tax=Gluconacetobacter entanii TaxID=108528 RepID=A0ABT3K2B4_9PROT|nr:hypothetical protein [Gluconacetobacter entanii]MCW4589545.1 hypothetical protein [Gluconacetobacter entanii]MCW4593358.1 hypothetical protein [Gluconacetobacter entanii]NPC88403.1 hypothetical protein [Gluconacetobacter entanii]